MSQFAKIDFAILQDFCRYAKRRLQMQNLKTGIKSISQICNKSKKSCSIENCPLIKRNNFIPQQMIFSTLRNYSY